MIDGTQPFLMAVQGMQVRGVSETGAQQFLKGEPVAAGNDRLRIAHGPQTTPGLTGMATARTKSRPSVPPGKLAWSLGQNVGPAWLMLGGGALVGSFFGPPGTVAGAVIGGSAGIAYQLWNAHFQKSQRDLWATSIEGLRYVNREADRMGKR